LRLFFYFLLELWRVRPIPPPLSVASSLPRPSTNLLSTSGRFSVGVTNSEPRFTSCPQNSPSRIQLTRTPPLLGAVTDYPLLLVCFLAGPILGPRRGPLVEPPLSLFRALSPTVIVRRLAVLFPPIPVPSSQRFRCSVRSPLRRDTWADPVHEPFCRRTPPRPLEVGSSSFPSPLTN